MHKIHQLQCGEINKVVNLLLYTQTTLWQETLPEDDLLAAKNYNEGCVFRPLINHGAEIETNGNVLYLPDHDIGEGTTILPIIRNDMDLELLDWCVLDLIRDKKKRRTHYRVKAVALLRKLCLGITKKELSNIMNLFGSFMQTISFVELNRSPDGCLWMLIHGGCKELSKLVLEAEPGRYKNGKQQLHDLQLIQAFSAMNRCHIAMQLFRLYYEADSISEAAFTIANTDFDSISMKKGLVALGGTYVKRKRFYLFLAGMGRGAYLMQSKYHRTRPLPNHLCRIDTLPTDIPDWEDILSKELAGIHCARNYSRMRYASKMYQHMFELPYGTTAMRLKPIYNIRPSDIETLRNHYE